MSITFTIKQAIDAIPYIVNNRTGKAKFGIMLRGPHGIGKSEVVKQIAEQLGLPLVDVRLSQKSEGDLMGLPEIEKGEKYNSTRFNSPSWFMQCVNEPTLLFLDEWDRAPMEVRQGAFELGDSRKLDMKELHQDTLIFTACNSGMHEGADQYDVNDLDPAEADRWFVIDLAPSVDDWLDWAARNDIEEVIWDFHSENSRGENSYLEHKGTFDPNKVYPSRRSWARFDDALKNYMLINNKSHVGEIDDAFMLFIGSGFLGEETIIAFMEYSNRYKHGNVLRLEDILDHGKFHKLNKFEITDHTAWIEKFKNTYDIKNKKVLSLSQIQNLAEYIVNYCPPEVAVVLFDHMQTKPEKAEDFKKVFQRTRRDFGDVIPKGMSMADLNAFKNAKVIDKVTNKEITVFDFYISISKINDGASF